jgi:hypothetical protein
MKTLNLEELIEFNFNSDLVKQEELRRENISERNRENHKTWGDTRERWIKRHLHRGTQSNAKEKNVVNTLTPVTLGKMWDLQKGKCAISGVELVWGEVDNIRRASVDQIYPSGGYTLENTWLVCSGINFLKNKFSLTDLLDIYPQAIKSPLFNEVYEATLNDKIPTHNKSIINDLQLLD